MKSTVVVHNGMVLLDHSDIAEQQYYFEHVSKSVSETSREFRNFWGGRDGKCQVTYCQFKLKEKTVFCKLQIDAFSVAMKAEDSFFV